MIYLYENRIQNFIKGISLPVKQTMYRFQNREELQYIKEEHNRNIEECKQIENKQERELCLEQSEQIFDERMIKFYNT